MEKAWQREIDALRAEREQLRALIAEYERRLGIPSFASAAAKRPNDKTVTPYAPTGRAPAAKDQG